MERAYVSSESQEDKDRREMLAAISRTLTPEENAAFSAIGDPGISEAERQERIAAFNALKAGQADSEEVLAERVYTRVPINLSGKLIYVSRDMRGRFQIEELS